MRTRSASACSRQGLVVESGRNPLTSASAAPRVVAIAPFKALRYKDAPLTDVTSPPHDVISPEERDAFIARDPRNVCQVILPPGDDMQGAAKTLQQWLQDEVLVRDPSPGFYLYEIRHGPPEARRRMRGFFCRLKVDPDYDEVRRHERTLGKKRSIRLDLLRATNVNTESIWMLYRDERGWVEEVLWSNAFDELCRFTDEEGNEHRVWKVDRPEAMEEVRAQFDDQTIVIADGHHRYATQCKRYAETGKDEDGSILVCMVRDTDPGLYIKPTDRLIIGLEDVPGLVARNEHWDVEPIDLPAADGDAADLLRSHIEDGHTCAVVAGDAAWLLRLKDGHAVDAGRGTLDSLAVTTVHDRLLAPWGIGDDDVEERLRFTRSDEEAVQRVRSGEFPAAVLLAPEAVEAVLDVAREGHLMPQKSTYFIPKLRSGLLMSPCDEPLPTKWSEQVTDPGKADFQMPDL